MTSWINCDKHIQNTKWTTTYVLLYIYIHKCVHTHAHKVTLESFPTGMAVPLILSGWFSPTHHQPHRTSFPSAPSPFYPFTPFCSPNTCHIQKSYKFSLWLTDPRDYELQEARMTRGWGNSHHTRWTVHGAQFNFREYWMDKFKKS
jgi:hypothetical protein